MTGVLAALPCSRGMALGRCVGRADPGVLAYGVESAWS